MRFHVAFARLSAGAGLLVLLAGCGGGSSSPAAGPTNSVGGTTKQAMASATNAVVVPATNGTTQTITVAGTPEQVVIPSGAPANIPAGTPLAVVGSGSAIVHGTFPANTAVSVNGVAASGVTIDTSGNIAQNVALPVDSTTGTSYSLTIPQGTVSGRGLTVRGGITVSGRFYFRNNGVVSPLPTGLTGIIPNNGENAVGSTVTVNFSDGNNGRTAQLTIDYGNGFVLDQTRTIQNNTVKFENLTTDASNVPANGISTIAFNIGP